MQEKRDDCLGHTWQLLKSVYGTVRLESTVEMQYRRTNEGLRAQQPTHMSTSVVENGMLIKHRGCSSRTSMWAREAQRQGIELDGSAGSKIVTATPDLLQVVLSGAHN